MESEDTAFWYIYMVRTGSGKLYTGIAKNVEKRFAEHQAMHAGLSAKGAKYFRAEKPVEIVYVEQATDRSAATKREIEIKKFTRKKKLSLVKRD